MKDVTKTPSTRSYIFLEYAAPTQALEAVKNADGYKLDKQHTFRVNLFTDFDKYVGRISKRSSDLSADVETFELLMFFSGTWTSVMSGKLQRNSLSRILWVRPLTNQS